MSKSVSSAPQPARTQARATATFVPYFWEAYNEIVEPRRFDHYLIRKWLPDLGQNGFVIIKVLRDRCYHNPTTGVLRDSVEVDLEELAAACKMSRRTLLREFSDNAALSVFVRRIKQYQIRGGRPQQRENLYQVSMDDPVHPDDLARYDELRALKEQERNQPLPKKIVHPESVSTSSTNANGKSKKPISYEGQNGTHRDTVDSSYEGHFGTHSKTWDSYECQNDTPDPKGLPGQNDTPDPKGLPCQDGTAIVNSPSGGSIPLGSLTPPAVDAQARLTPSHECDPPGDGEKETAAPEPDPDAIAREIRDSLLCVAWSQAIADVGQSAGAATRRMLLPALQLAAVDEETGAAEVLCPSDAIRDQARKHAAALQEALSAHLARSVTIRLVTEDKEAT